MLINAPIRKYDKYGSGAFGSLRGSRKHKGVDIACHKGSGILSVSDGEVTKIGYPYNPDDPKKGHLRYIQISYGDLDFRYFYIIPSVKVGDKIKKGDLIGITAGLNDIYPGIIDHMHFEVKENGKYLNPNKVLEDLIC